MIPEPQRTYVLELIHALGPLGEGFVVAGAQAMKFAIIKARGTKDVDFILDVVHLRGKQKLISAKLGELGPARMAVLKGKVMFSMPAFGWMCPDKNHASTSA